MLNNDNATEHTMLNNNNATEHTKSPNKTNDIDECSTANNHILYSNSIKEEKSDSEISSNKNDEMNSKKIICKADELSKLTHAIFLTEVISRKILEFLGTIYEFILSIIEYAKKKSDVKKITFDDETSIQLSIYDQYDHIVTYNLYLTIHPKILHISTKFLHHIMKLLLEHEYQQNKNEECKKFFYNMVYSRQPTKYKTIHYAVNILFFYSANYSQHYSLVYLFSHMIKKNSIYNIIHDMFNFIHHLEVCENFDYSDHKEYNSIKIAIKILVSDIGKKFCDSFDKDHKIQKEICSLHKLIAKNTTIDITHLNNHYQYLKNLISKSIITHANNFIMFYLIEIIKIEMKNENQDFIYFVRNFFNQKISTESSDVILDYQAKSVTEVQLNKSDDAIHTESSDVILDYQAKSVTEVQLNKSDDAIHTESSDVILDYQAKELDIIKKFISRLYETIKQEYNFSITDKNTELDLKKEILHSLMQNKKREMFEIFVTNIKNHILENFSDEMKMSILQYDPTNLFEAIMKDAYEDLSKENSSNTFDLKLIILEKLPKEHKDKISKNIDQYSECMKFDKSQKALKSTIPENILNDINEKILKDLPEHLKSPILEKLSRYFNKKIINNIFNNTKEKILNCLPMNLHDKVSKSIPDDLIENMLDFMYKSVPNTDIDCVSLSDCINENAEFIVKKYHKCTDITDPKIRYWCCGHSNAECHNPSI